MSDRIFNPYDRPLAITPAKLEQICEVYDRHARGEKLDFSALSLRIAGAPVHQPYQMQDGVAVISVDGVLAKRMNLMMDISGGTSTEILQNDIAAAVADPGVHAILLAIDSPGGEVDGTQLAANAIKQASAQKPTAASIGGAGASAAYWLAASTDAIYLADDTTMVGSIGVVATHRDRSGADAQSGIKRTEITAGKYKRLVSDTGPLSVEGRADIQDKLDHMYSVFVDAVAAGRGKTSDQVHAEMADGRTFLGKQGVDSGLADGIATKDEVVAKLNAAYQQRLQNPGARASATHATQEKHMFTQEQMDAARAEEHAKGKAEGMTEGATAELSRIKGIAGLQMPGHAALVKTLMFDGKTSPEQAAVQLVNAQQQALAKAGTDLEADAKDLTTTGSAADPKTEAKLAVEAVATATGAKGDDNLDPAAHAQAIRAHVAKAKAEGRNLNAAQADQELQALAAK